MTGDDDTIGSAPLGTESEHHFRSGYVALIGSPNVGKSTLMNALIGMKLSIVTRKAQTTRHRVLGVLTTDDYQIIFLDTPGIIDPKYGLQRAMMRTVDRALDDADVLIHIVDATRGTNQLSRIPRLEGRSVVLAVNKIDAVSKDTVIELVAKVTESHDYDAVVPISAKEGVQLKDLLDEVAELLPRGPAYYPPDMITEHPERFFAAELIREKIFERFHKEVPYSVQVNIVGWEERSEEKDLIDGEIIVERESQKAIIIGKGGSALKQVGIAARRDIEEMTGRSVFLRLFVKVRGGWRNEDSRLREYGYE